MLDTSNIEVRLTSMEDHHSIALSQRQRDEILLTSPNLPPFTVELPFFIVLIRAGEAIACGGLRPLDDNNHDHLAEIKRVYVLPEARGRAQGVADFLMEQLESHALARGWTTIRLQTSRNMVVANRFYERHGYRLVKNYGEYVDCQVTISYEKTLGSGS